jgi:hypothetical protein
MKVIVGVLVLALIAGAAQAQQPPRTTTFYGPTGGYRGQAITNPNMGGMGGGTTTFYGPTGGYQGQAITAPNVGGMSGGTTTYYGPNGQYLGTSTRR